MKKFTAYDTETQEILYCGEARSLDDQVEEGISVAEGHGSPLTHRIVNGKLRLLPKRTRKRNLKKRALRKLRAKRDARLRKMDGQLSPMRWDALTPEQQQAWRDYRQALLDLPANTTDPENITWPTPPA